MLLGGAAFGIARANAGARAASSTTASGIVHVLAGQFNVANSSRHLPERTRHWRRPQPTGRVGDLWRPSLHRRQSGQLCRRADQQRDPDSGGRDRYTGVQRRWDSRHQRGALRSKWIGLRLAGDLFIADTLNERIREVNTQGIISTVAGTGAYGFSGDNGPATEAQLNYPLDVAVAPGGGFYIADTQNERIRYVDASGTITTIAGDESGIDYGGDEGPAVDAALATPAAVAVAPNGDVYIGDVTNNRVRYIDGSGIIHTAAGNDAPGGYDATHTVATETSLYNPYSVAFDPSGNLYMADSTNCLIREVDNSGIIANLVGNPGHCGYGPGDNQPGTSSWVNRPYAIAVDAAGDVFIADTHNDLVRELVAPESPSPTSS